MRTLLSIGDLFSSESSRTSNFYLEDSKEIRQRDIKYCASGSTIDPLNIIHSRDLSLEEIRLSDSLEDIDHVPNRSSLLPDTSELEEINRELARNRSQTFNDFFKNAYIRHEKMQWSLSLPKKSTAPPRPPMPDLSRPKVPRAVEEDFTSNCGLSDRSSIDSGASLHSDCSGDFSTFTDLC